MPTIEVTGLPEVEAKLLALDAKIRPGLLATSRPGAKLLRDAIRAEAPVGQRPRPTQNDVPGNLRNSVQFKASRKRSGFTGQVVAPYGKGSAHRYLVIAGHEIKGHGHSLFGAKLSVKRFGHKGTSGKTSTTPNPFVQRGRERVEAQALAATELAAIKVVERAVKL
jgi:hypothetical protein